VPFTLMAFLSDSAVDAIHPVLRRTPRPDAEYPAFHPLKAVEAVGVKHKREGGLQECTMSAIFWCW
jgi:hypothetical protein